jgi:hypothetical protein
MYYYRGGNANDPADGTNAGETLPGSSIQEQELNARARAIVSRYSNMGADNPAKSLNPLPRSLFYDAAKLDPDVKEAEKYGLFMFYSFGGGGGNSYLDQYYLSERPNYNNIISPIESKNPTAYQLVKDSSGYSPLLLDSGDTLQSTSPIKGGPNAPYYWKDFIYCKYYGTIPNNRLITLRRFSSPVLDNFSIPKGLQTPENLKRGVGMPVAQAITWFGGKSGNTLSGLIGFSTGLEWGDQPSEPIRYQKAFGDGLINSTAFKTLINLIAQGDEKAAGVLATNDNKIGAEAVATALSPEGSELTKNRFFQAFFDAAKGDESGRFGILSERIFVPVDVITKTQKRKYGLSFTWEDLSIKFTYDLTSVGEVNTKAAMFDILGNLLSIGTNYGNFLTPYIRYQSDYSALTFPGGDAGAKQYYTDIQGFVMANASKMFLADKDTVKTVGGTDLTEGSVKESKDALAEVQKALKEGKSIKDLEPGLLQKAFAGIQGALAESAATDWQSPLSLYTGAPIGEWHLVIGNPYNPIAMIGNLICKSVSVSFGDELGPDDFPSTIEATIILAHGRERERGEIESIFNQGDGRFYQTVKSTSSNSQTYKTVVDLAGTVSTNENLNGILSPTNGGVAGSGTTTTFEDINNSTNIRVGGS